MARAAHADMRSTITRAGQGMAINLAPLVAPYRKHGRISIRVERLPQQARFSRGNRNSNGSWSLASDELDDLFYHVPEGVSEHTLAIRIVNLTGGNTLAVVDFPVIPVAETEEEEAAHGATAGETDELVQTLRQQLAQMKAALTTRESELAEARKAAARAAAAPERDTDAEVAALHAELQAEFDERLAAVGAQSAADLKKQRESWAADLNARVAALSAKAQQQINEAGETAEREKQQALEQAKEAWQRDETERLAKAKADWRAEADKAIASASAARDKGREADLETLRAQLQRDARDALHAAEQDWKAAEAARLAAAKIEWQTKSEKQLAELRAEVASAHGKDAESALATQRAKLEREAKCALADAEQEWKTQEAARLTAAKADWQATLAKALKEERAAAAAAGDKNSDTALKDLRDELRTVRATLAERDAALAEAANAAERAAREAQHKLDAERVNWQAETDNAIAKARATAAAQANGSDVAQNELRQQLSALNTKLVEKDSALTAARAKVEDLRREKEAALAEVPLAAAHNAVGADEDLRGTIASLEGRLAEREAAFAEAREIIEQQRVAAQAKPQRNRRKEDANEDQRWQAITNELAEARSRYEAAELALAQIRMRAKDEGRIHQDLASTRAALAAREKELFDLRAKFTPLDGQGADDGAFDGAATPVQSEPPTKQQYSKAFIGSVTAAAGLLALAIIFYPTIQAALFPAPPPPKAAPEIKDIARLEPVVVETKAVLLRDAKLRAEPSSSAKGVATVTKGFEVVVLESKGKWTLVRMGSAADAQQGWLQASVLDEVAAPDAAPHAPVKRQ